MVLRGGTEVKVVTEGSKSPVAALKLQGQRPEWQSYSPWKPVPWAFHEPKKLRTGEYEIEHLGNEEQDESFGEVALDSDSGEGHAGEVTKGVAGEGFGRIPM